MTDRTAAPAGAPDEELDSTLRLVRRRWRLRVALGGLALLVLAACAALVVRQVKQLT